MMQREKVLTIEHRQHPINE